MGYAHIEIKSKRSPSAFTEVYLDGHKVEGVRRFTLTQEIGNTLPTLTLDLNAVDLSVDGEIVKYNMDNMPDFKIKWEDDEFGGESS